MLQSIKSKVCFEVNESIRMMKHIFSYLSLKKCKGIQNKAWIFAKILLWAAIICTSVKYLSVAIETPDFFLEHFVYTKKIFAFPFIYLGMPYCDAVMTAIIAHDL